METRKDRDGNLIHWLDDTWGILEIHSPGENSQFHGYKPPQTLYQVVMMVTPSGLYITLDGIYGSFESGMTAIENEMVAMNWIERNLK